MFIGDVGASLWEEVNQGAAGRNYGWPTHEGAGGGAGFTDPVFAYNHNTGNPSGCAVMGGDFYNPDVAQLPAQFKGTFIFPDHCQGWVKALDFAHGNAIYPILGGLEQPVDLKVDPNIRRDLLHHAVPQRGRWRRAVPDRSPTGRFAAADHPTAREIEPSRGEPTPRSRWRPRARRPSGSSGSATG